MNNPSYRSFRLYFTDTQLKSPTFKEDFAESFTIMNYNRLFQDQNGFYHINPPKELPDLRFVRAFPRYPFVYIELSKSGETLKGYSTRHHDLIALQPQVGNLTEACRAYLREYTHPVAYQIEGHYVWSNSLDMALIRYEEVYGHTVSKAGRWVRG